VTAHERAGDEGNALQLSGEEAFRDINYTSFVVALKPDVDCERRRAAQRSVMFTFKRSPSPAHVIAQVWSDINCAVRSTLFPKPERKSSHGARDTREGIEWIIREIYLPVVQGGSGLLRSLLLQRAAIGYWLLGAQNRTFNKTHKVASPRLLSPLCYP
jgi:hypothetical protein